MPRKSFADLVASPGMPVLVDFYADWCGPCKAMAPVLEQVAAQHRGKLRVVKIDVDKNPALARQYRVQSIPTLILFRQGQPVWRQAGAVPGPQLAQALQPFLSCRVARRAERSAAELKHLCRVSDACACVSMVKRCFNSAALRSARPFFELKKPRRQFRGGQRV